MKQPIYLLTLLILACNPTPSSNEQEMTSRSDTTEIEKPATKIAAKTKPQQNNLQLKGIYQYDYPNDTPDLNEDQYIAFKKEGDTLRAWYFGTSDEFDLAREGYLPGYFVSEIENLITRGDSIFFSITTAHNRCFTIRPPIGLIDQNVLSEQYQQWNHANELQTVNYSGKLDGLNLAINMFGEARNYRKTRSDFYPGIDNYDTTKCRTQPLLTLDQNLGDLTDQMVLNFLDAFSVICDTNIEFSQWSNELLFKVLEENPKQLLQVLSDNLADLDTAAIYDELESPLHDLIPIDSITSEIKLLNIDDQLKTSVLERLGNLD